MPRTIKLTEEQFRLLQENMFKTGIDDANPIPDYQMSQINADGVMDYGEMGKPTTTDQVDVMTKMFPWGYGNYARGYPGMNLREDNDSDVEISDLNVDSNTRDENGVRLSNTPAYIDELSDENEKDDMEIISNTVERNIDGILKIVNSQNTPQVKRVEIAKALSNALYGNGQAANLSGIPIKVSNFINALAKSSRNLQPKVKDALYNKLITNFNLQGVMPSQGKAISNTGTNNAQSQKYFDRMGKSKSGMNV